MTIDELLDVWKAHDDEPLYAINQDALQMILRERSTNLRDVLFSDEIKNYWTGLWIIGFLALWFWLGPGEGAFGQAYFVTLAIATAAVLYFIGYSIFFVAQRRPQAPASTFANSLREQLDCEIEYVTYQIAARTQWYRVLLHLVPPWLACVIVVWAAGYRDDGILELTNLLSMAVVTGGWVHMHILERRWVSRELAPRKHELQVLRQKLVEPEAN